jgi:crossover junction endodeoxyribonuclease RuvC
MQEMIKRLLHLDEVPKPDDAADGLSIALCHIHIMR